MKKTPDLYELVRADQVRAAQKVPRKGNNPWKPEPMAYLGLSRSDPTADAALRNIQREQKNSKSPR